MKGLTEHQRKVLEMPVMFQNIDFVVRDAGDESVCIHYRDAVKVGKFHSNIFVYADANDMTILETQGHSKDQILSILYGR